MTKRLLSLIFWLQLITTVFGQDTAAALPDITDCLVAKNGFRKTKPYRCPRDTVGCRVVFTEGKMDHHSDDVSTGCLKKYIFTSYYKTESNTCNRAQSGKVVKCWCNDGDLCNTRDRMLQIYETFIDLEKVRPSPEPPTFAPLPTYNHNTKPSQYSNSNNQKEQNKPSKSHEEKSLSDRTHGDSSTESQEVTNSAPSFMSPKNLTFLFLFGFSLVQIFVLHL